VSRTTTTRAQGGTSNHISHTTQQQQKKSEQFRGSTGANNHRATTQPAKIAQQRNQTVPNPTHTGKSKKEKNQASILEGAKIKLYGS
jgi:hypothetical protein